MLYFDVLVFVPFQYDTLFATPVPLERVEPHTLLSISSVLKYPEASRTITELSVPAPILAARTVLPKFAAPVTVKPVPTDTVEVVNNVVTSETAPALISIPFMVSFVAAVKVPVNTPLLDELMAPVTVKPAPTLTVLER